MTNCTKLEVELMDVIYQLTPDETRDALIMVNCINDKVDFPERIQARLREAGLSPEQISNS